MAGVIFYGSGSVCLPGGGFARFKDGIYETDKPSEIELLAKKYKHDTPVRKIEQADEPEEARPKRGRSRKID